MSGGKTVLGATTAALAFSSITQLFPSAIAPEIAASLNVSPALIGIQISLAYFGAMFSSLMGGGISQRLGACRTTQLAILFFGLGGVLAAIADIRTFVLASLLIGVGYGLTNPAAAHLLVRFTNPSRRGLVFGIKQTGVPLGGVIAGIMAPALTVTFGWQVAMASLAIPSILGIVWLQRFHQRWDDDADTTARWLSSPLSDIRLVWRLKPLRWTALATFFFSASQLCLTAFTVTLLVEDLGVALVTAGLMMSAVQISGVGGRVLWGWIADRISRGLPTLIFIHSLSALLTIAVANLQPDTPPILVAIVLCSLGLVAIGWNGVYLAEISRLSPPGDIARCSGGALFITFAGVLAGPGAFTALHLLTHSYSQTFLLIGVSSLTGIALLIAAMRASSGQRS